VNRRAFIGTLTGSLLAPLLAAEAQQAGKVPRIVVIFSNAPEDTLQGSSPSNQFMREFLEEMRALGWRDGQSINIERRSIEGKSERVAPMMAALRGRDLDLVVASIGTAPIPALKEAVGSIPLVWLGVIPEWIVKTGLAKSLARPGGTVTGLTDFVQDLGAKRLQLLKEAIPRVSRVAYLSVAPSAIPPDLEVSANALSITLQRVQVAAPEGLDDAFTTMRAKRAEAVVLGNGWFFQGHARKLADLALRERLASLCRDRVFTNNGALLSYGTDWSDLFRRAPAYVDKILKGMRPGDLPIEQPTKFELIINLKTAKALGLTIPSSLLQRADHVIE
jgi:putative ABC transport system substrate-binding protein